jgi:hypothetical protein
MNATSKDRFLKRLCATALILAGGLGFGVAAANATGNPKIPAAVGLHKTHGAPRMLHAPTRHTPRELENELGESGPDPYSTDYMLYRGGSVQTSPHLYIVYWGDWSSSGDPYGVQNRLYYFLSGIGGSSWATTLTQYAQGCYVNTFSCPPNAVYVTNPTGQLKGWWKDAIAVPSTPTPGQVAQEAARAAAHFGDYSVNAQYVVALPRGHGDTQFKSGAACAYHSWTNAGPGAISFTDLPYMPDAGNTCGNYSVTGSILDGVTITESHEYAESVTDPWVGASGYMGWADSTLNAGEAGDKCAYISGRVALSTGTFPAQSIWSNYSRYYYGYGCVLSS